MKVIIAGTRYVTDTGGNRNLFDDYEQVAAAVLNSGFILTEVVSGTAKGVDTLGESIAYELDIPVKRFPADWTRYGLSAGIIRNREMARYADAAIVIWDGESTGSKNMIREMEHLNKPVYVAMIEKNNED